MFDLSAIQIIIVLIIALVVFGPKRLPELGRQLGKGLREMKGQVASLTDELREAGSETPRPSPAAVDPVVVPTAAVEDDDDLLEGVVVSGASAPEAPRPTDAQ